MLDVFHINASISVILNNKNIYTAIEKVLFILFILNITILTSKIVFTFMNLFYCSYFIMNLI